MTAAGYPPSAGDGADGPAAEAAGKKRVSPALVHGGVAPELACGEVCRLLPGSGRRLRSDAAGGGLRERRDGESAVPNRGHVPTGAGARALDPP
ncbi:hypothetical protein ACIHAR_18175 [Streptomyces sp. NPDC052016]|uniref:hypothetical protein n=1 Tax=Streptomyces sp. NPDC052016 TaxID=3365680 RepID=UPI0037D6B0EE